MKKGLIFAVLSMCTVLASAKTFIDKTNLDQLNFRVLDSGQVTWNEEDGSAVIYVGSPTEVKNIRVADPTALRGYRMKTIDDELTVNASAAFTNPNPGVWLWTSSNNDVYKYEYIDIEKTGGNVTVTGDEGRHWKIGFATKNNNGTYTDIATPAVGTLVGGSNLTANVQYAYKHKYVELKLEVISKDTNIQALDFLFEQSVPEGLGEMDPIGTSRQIVYDGRHATVIIKVEYTSGNGKFVRVQDFSASCIGIGDVYQANDLAKTKILIYDSLTDENGRHKSKHWKSSNGSIYEDMEEDPTAGAFDLYNLRHWVKHLYDGNRGEDWSKYPARDHVNLDALHGIYWRTPNAGETYMGVSGNSTIITSQGEAWFEYRPGDDTVSTEYQGVQIEFTSIKQNSINSDGNNSWVLEMMMDVPAGKSIPPQSQINVLYSAGLERPILWYPIVCEWESLDGGVGKEWRITVPEIYSVPNRGFWKLKFTGGMVTAALKLKCNVDIMGSDGRLYRLSWPEGGGTVTATLVE